MGKNGAIGGDDNVPQKRSVGDATSYKSSVGKDQMDGMGGDTSPSPPIKMSEGNILEAHGRDTSNSSVTGLDGWGGEDAPYAGMATEAPYGGGAGMKGSSPSKGRRG